MDVDTALALADTLIFNKTKQHLNTLQAQVFRGAWSGLTYEEMVQVCHCSETHLKRVGSILWELLSIGLAEEVNKKTFRIMLERYSLNGDSSAIAQTAPAYSASSQLTKAQAFTASSSEELQFPEGAVEVGSRFYVERPPTESQCYKTVLKPGALICIKAPRQMGKTSLLARVLNHAQQHGYQTIALNLQLVDSKTFEDLNLFLKWFCATVTRKLNLPLRLEDYWDDIFGSKTSCRDYFEHYLMPQIAQPLVLALDEVDAVFQYPEIAKHFFALLRAWHEEGKTSDIWQNLRLVLVHSTEVYIPLSINQSPFNVGIPIDLQEFNAEQIADLARRHELDWHTDQVEQLMSLVGGHPYLVRVALYQIAYQMLSLEKLLQVAATEAGPYRNHLRRYLSILKEQPNLGIAFKSLLNNESTRLASLEIFQLERMGLIGLQGDQSRIRCELYRQYFSSRL